ncbi:methyltransferase domain-containing protein [uncultured Helicobacter sp.]|uniref:methyltransferase domain-containing protein n=1 Tax=uncultured Helicobacter sp. TaxID=175537 RepID=UPI0026253C4D|nr:methyltransferase domain-containing protein [uncultured Helicobacter sp.]
MHAQKTQIQQRFHRAKPTYAQNALIQTTMQETLLMILQRHCLSKNLGNVLELGCGNGLLSQKVAKTFDFKSYLAVDLVDFSKDFAKIQQNSTYKMTFLQRDFEDVSTIKNINPILKYDWILSNAAIQWTNQTSFLPKLNSLLQTNGFLAFSTFGKENFQELREILGVGLEYLELKDYAEALESHFKIVESFETKIPLRFENTLAIFKHLQNTGVNSLKQGFKLHKAHFKEYAMRFHNTLTYNPLYILAQKKFEI